MQAGIGSCRHAKGAPGEDDAREIEDALRRRDRKRKPEKPQRPVSELVDGLGNRPGTEIALRIYLLIGFLALSGLIVLAATSTDAAVGRLGSRRWNSLHRLVYGIAVLASVHFFIQSKLDLYQPVLMAGLLVWLLAFRVLFRRNGELTPLHLFFLAAAAAVATAAGEATIYMLSSGVDAHRILLAHFDIDMEVRPAWWVLTAGLAVALAGSWRYKPGRARTRPRAIASPIVVPRATQVQ